MVKDVYRAFSNVLSDFDKSENESKNSNSYPPINSKGVKYQRLRSSYDDCGYVDLQFQKPPPKVPIKAIGLASFLFLAGFSAITVAILTFTGHLNFHPTDGTVVLFVLGFVMFIPGFYHIRLAYYAFKEYPGYSYDDIPDFN